MNRTLKCFLSSCAVIAMLSPVAPVADAGKNPPALEPGKRIEFTFTNADLPPTLYSMMNGAA